MKRLTAILLAIALTISACASPAGDGGSASEETDSQNGEVTEDLTEAEWTAEDRTDREEGFVPAEEAQESGEEQLVEEQSAEEQPASEEDIPSESLEMPESSESSSQQESKPGLVILEEDDGDFRGTAGLKASDIDEKTSQLHAVKNGSGDSKTGGDTAAKTVKEYTVMVYIVGSNLESRLGAATTDIGEMKQAGIDFGKTNLLVYTGGSRRWVSDIPNKFNSVLDLSTAGGSQIIAQTQESADMGMPQTLTEFINYCTALYPARHYGLIFWDHGAGPLWGYGSDELFGNDSLLLEELRRAMDASVFGPGRKLDWVGFDACLMGNLENAKSQ